MYVDNYSVFYLPYESRSVVTIIAIMYSARDTQRHLKTPDDYNLELLQE